MLAQPELNHNVPAILYETGTVYANSETFRPRIHNMNIKLLIWPEQARSGRPRVSEGNITGVKIKPPLKSEEVFHIIGQETRIEEGLQNSSLALSPEGDILSVRAKKNLFPSLETPFYSFMFPGRLSYIPGRSSSLLEFNGKRIINLLCFEQMDHYLVKEAAQQGADLITIMARDTVTGATPEVYSLFTGMAVLLAVETGIPVIRSSMSGPSLIIAPDGRILADSKPHQNGILVINR